MKKSLFCYVCSLVAVLLTAITCLQAQVCTIGYSSDIYHSTLFDTITTATCTPSGEVVAAGTIMDLNCFVRKYSAGGTLLWSKHYNTVYHPFTNRFFGYMTLHDVVCPSDSNYLVTGTVSEIFYGFGITLKHMGLVMSLDRYGNIRWSNSIRTVFGDELSVAASLATKEGDNIVYISTNNGPRVFSFGKLLCYDNNGNMKWSSLLNSKLLDNGENGLFPKRSLLQLQNGDILLGDVLYTTDTAGNMPPNAKAVLHIAAFNQKTGVLKWETGYTIPFVNREQPDLIGISESADHSLTFYTSLRFTPGGQKKTVEIHTDAAGVLQHATAIYPSNGSESKLIKAYCTSGSDAQTLFIDAGGDPVVASYNPRSGQLSARSFTTAGHFSPAAMAKGIRHQYIFLKDMNNLNGQFMMTDSAGDIPCAALEKDMLTEPVYIDTLAERITTNARPNIDSFIFEGFGLRAIDYPLTRTNECQSAAQCCTNSSDSTYIDLCPGKTFTLPDGTAIRDSGSYYLTLQKPLGCDSVKFYFVSLRKDPKQLSLGSDTCLMGQDSIILHATPGFDSYNWSSMTTTDPVFTAKSPGLYQVSVSNICGSKTDIIQVFDQCEFPVFMPSAFTPNGDHLNDLFHVPPINKNRFKQLLVFNRWGQIIFKTTDPSTGWDGTINGKPADNGMYIFVLYMEGLTGKKITQKGTVTLIR